jgi:hypothetical protein
VVLAWYYTEVDVSHRAIRGNVMRDIGKCSRGMETLSHPLGGTKTKLNEGLWRCLGKENRQEELEVGERINHWD